MKKKVIILNPFPYLAIYFRMHEINIYKLLLLELSLFCFFLLFYGAIPGSAWDLVGYALTDYS